MPSTRDQGNRGFTLLELALVIVIVGTIVGTAVVSWYSLMESRKLAKTASTLQQMKSCLVKRIHFSERYPSYPATGLLDCAAGVTDAERCLCEGGLLDAWGREIYFLAGIDETGAGLDNVFLLDRPHQGREGEAVSPGPGSQVLDHEGVTVGDVAFVLISFGKDGQADNATYRNLFHPSSPNVRTAAIPDGVVPDFSSTDTGEDDDLYVVVTANELIGLLKR